MLVSFLALQFKIISEIRVHSFKNFDTRFISMRVFPLSDQLPIFFLQKGLNLMLQLPLILVFVLLQVHLLFLFKIALLFLVICLTLLYGDVFLMQVPATMIMRFIFKSFLHRYILFMGRRWRYTFEMLLVYRLLPLFTISFTLFVLQPFYLMFLMLF